MLYVAECVKKRRIFQKPYITDGKKIFITDTKRGRKSFLKSGIKNVVFRDVWQEAEGLLEKAEDYDRALVLDNLADMLIHLAEFKKLTLPIGEIAVFSSRGEDIYPRISPFARIITIVDDVHPCKVYEGVSIRYLRRLKALPDIVITEGERGVSEIFNVPTVNIGRKAVANQNTMTVRTVAFKSDAFDFDISMGQLMYFIKKGEISDYEAVSFRKKSPPLFTFC